VIRRRFWLGVSLVPVILGLAWAGWILMEPSGAEEGPATLTPYLAELLGERGLSAGRLTRGPAYAPSDERAGAISSFGDDRLLLLEVQLERAAQARRSAGDLHSLGLLRTFEGRFSQAIDALRAARLEAPEDAPLASDLASAYLGAAAESDGDPLQVLLAAEAAAQALALDPELPEARFNLALAVDQLSLRQQAQKAWEDYLELDPSSDWAGFARQRDGALDRPSPLDTWKGLTEGLETSAAPRLDEELREQIPRFPHLARELVEERLLPAWASATLEGRLDEAEPSLVLAEEIGVELAAIGDRMVLEETRAIRRAMTRGDRELLADVVEAHRDLAHGLTLGRGREPKAAEPLLASAEGALRRAGSPLADYAALRRSVGLRSQDLRASRQLLVEILRRAGEDPYPTLLGRVEWMLGLTFAYEGEYATALTWYEAAADHFTQVRDDIGLAGLQALTAEAYRKLGQPAAVWRSRLTGLAALGRIGDSGSQVRALEEAVTALTLEDRIDVALLFHNELLAQAGAWEGSSTAVPTALWKRATLLGRAGDVSSALIDLTGAERLLPGVPDEAERAWLRAEIEAVRGDLLVAQSPLEAHRLLTQAIEHGERLGHGTRLPALLHHRARAALELGHSSEAAENFERALFLAEERRLDPESEALRISFFETFQASYDAMVSFQAVELRDLETALLYADMPRSRALLDRLATPSPTQGEAAPAALHRLLSSSGESFVDRLQEALPESVALVEFATLTDRTFVWIVRKHGFQAVELALPAATLRRQVERLRSDLEHGAPRQKLLRSSGSLYESLIRPILPAIRGVERLVLVPDRYLYGLSFGALFDAESERHWLQEHELVLVPSAAHLLTNAATRPDGAQRRTALVVADPAFDRERFPHLDPLPGAAQEGRSIAEVYPRADLLMGVEATKENLLALVSRHPVLHLGMHAVVSGGDPSASTLALAPGSEDSDRGSLGLEELSSARLSEVEVAFLSACTTASAFPDHGREGFAGLVRGFLAAGVPTVVGTLWSVEDHISSELAIEFHEALARGADPATALRAAQLASLNSEDERRASPSTWAAFQVYSTQPGYPE
jgi:CHAT domain-containing protein